MGAPNAPPPCAAALGTVVSRAGGNVQCVATLLWRALDADDGLLLDTAVRTPCSLVGWRRRDRATSSSLWSVATRLAGQSARHCRRGQMLSPASLLSMVAGSMGWILLSQPPVEALHDRIYGRRSLLLNHEAFSFRSLRGLRRVWRGERVEYSTQRS